MQTVIPAWELPSLEVDGETARFPVRRIYCVGRNYAAHAREMGKDPDREPPFFFMKPADTLVADGHAVPYPSATTNLHYEVELVVALGKGGADIEPTQANRHIYGYAVGIDLTRRDLQQIAKDRSWPWDTAKGFDHSAPCGRLIPAARIGHPERGRISLKVGSETHQSGDLSELIWSVPEIVAHLSRLFRLEPGDLIFTGTPSGVGATQPGDTLTGSVEGVGTLTVTIGDADGSA